MTNPLYDPTNWYWIVGGSATQVFSSASMSYVDVTDSAYVDWSTSSNATRILNAQELVEVLINQAVPRLLANGVALQSTITPSLDATYAVDPLTQSQINSMVSAVNLGVIGSGTSTFTYAGLTFTGPQFIAVATALFSYIYGLSQAITQIVTTGSGSVPTVPLQIA